MIPQVSRESLPNQLLYAKDTIRTYKSLKLLTCPEILTDILKFLIPFKGSTGGMKRDDSANDLQYELKNRLSMHGQPDVPAQKPLNRVDSSPGNQPAMPDVDAGECHLFS